MSSTGAPSTMSAPPSTSTPAAASTSTICIVGKTVSGQNEHRCQPIAHAQPALIQHSATFSCPTLTRAVLRPIGTGLCGVRVASTPILAPFRRGTRVLLLTPAIWACCLWLLLVDLAATSFPISAMTSQHNQCLRSV
eukprot:GHRR01026090.1.p1 GENE.GHRR01026090.1~~GHRR01026090.1.p1  ORF type:complete len:137 (+),score=26.03 GHRR01026090.1:1108-1518(+)